MLSTISFTLLALAGLLEAAVLPGRDTGSQECVMEDLNQYCQPVSVISYQDLGGTGLYPEVIGMDLETGECTQKNVTFKGQLAPFNEPLSIHLRGPILLNQLAVYALNGGVNKARRRGQALGHHMGKRDSAAHADAPATAPGVQVVTDVVTEVTTVTVTVEEDDEATMTLPVLPTGTSSTSHTTFLKGTHITKFSETSPKATQVSTRSSQSRLAQNSTGVFPSGANQASSRSSQSRLSQTSTGVSPSGTNQASSRSSHTRLSQTSTGGSPSGTSLGSPTGSSGGEGESGEMTRVGYYNADAQNLEGMVFLGNYGGEGSGVSAAFGASLSYINSNATGGAANATILQKGLVPSEHEFALFSDEPCDDSCGFVQPGSVAYKGFEGAKLVILFEFSMPHDDTTYSTGFQGNMPAIWLLNSKIPRTAQYNSCSCWPGCGELDLFEVLGNNTGAGEKLIATVHKDISTGDPNYFPRPTDSPIVAAAAFDADGNVVVIKILSDSWLGQLPTSLDSVQMAQIYSNTSSLQGLGSSAKAALNLD